MVKKAKNVKYYEGIGRRKEAVARVRLYIVGKDKTAEVGKIKIKAGEAYINEKILSQTAIPQYQRDFMFSPLSATGNDGRFAVSILISGGGPNSQIEAIVHGVSRALDLVDRTEYRPILKNLGLLTRDPRTRERRKVGTGGKARRVKQSPKR